jgi:hypothetical protein
MFISQVQDLVGQSLKGVRESATAPPMTYANLTSRIGMFSPKDLRFVEYRVGNDEYLRMKFKVSGPLSQGVVQLEMKKEKV